MRTRLGVLVELCASLTLSSEGELSDALIDVAQIVSGSSSGKEDQDPRHRIHCARRDSCCWASGVSWQWRMDPAVRK